jgi:hypothetical protein
MGFVMKQLSFVFALNGILQVESMLNNNAGGELL